MTTKITCDEAEEMLAAHALGCDDTDVAPLHKHLGDCAGCRVAAAEYQNTAAMLPLALDSMTPDPKLRSRVMAAIHADATSAASSPAPTPVTESHWRRMWNAIPVGRAFTVATIAASLAVVAIIGGNAARGPEVQHTVGQGTAAQPQAHADLFVDARNKVATLQVNNLPKTSSGVYEVWAVGQDGHPRAAGYLGPNPDGTYSAAMNADMTGVTHIRVTLEPKASTQPTTTPLLDVPVTN